MIMRDISVADYLIEFFIANGVKDVFGYQGGMVCHIFDSLGKYRKQISYHNCGNEQGAALAACGYAQSTGKLGVCITTSGPGFTNAITGLADAWFDSLPVMLISGQVNTKDKRRDYTFRQYGFQEMQTVEMVSSITKKSYEIDVDSDIPAILEDAFRIAFEGRRGPVFLDFPINIGRKIVEIENSTLDPIVLEKPPLFDASYYIDQLLAAKKPIILAGAGITQCGMREMFRELVVLLGIPVVTTMPGVDLIPSQSPYHVGFLGGTARREPGMVLKNTDFVLALGTRMCNKAIGYDHKQFIPKAEGFVRVDIDEREFERQLKSCETDVVADIRSFIESAIVYARKISGTHVHDKWVNAVNEMQMVMATVDNTIGNEFVKHFTELIPANAVITADVGNNQVYTAQSSVIKNETRIYASCGLGSMGFAIPAAIGVAVGSGERTYAISGDGGAQMNIQELNTIAKMDIPVKVLVLNNRSLGHIVLFQEHYLDNRFVATKEENNDYYSCDFSAIAKAYGIRSHRIKTVEELEELADELLDPAPLLIEVEFDDCSMLPNIHGGLDPLTNGPVLPADLIDRVNALFDF